MVLTHFNTLRGQAKKISHGDAEETQVEMDRRTTNSRGDSRRQVGSSQPFHVIMGLISQLQSSQTDVTAFLMCSTSPCL